MDSFGTCKNKGGVELALTALIEIQMTSKQPSWLKRFASYEECRVAASQMAGLSS